MRVWAVNGNCLAVPLTDSLSAPTPLQPPHHQPPPVETPNTPVSRRQRTSHHHPTTPKGGKGGKTKTVEPLDDSGDHTELESALKSSNRNCESALIAVALQ